jgi:hypothetical protein
MLNIHFYTVHLFKKIILMPVYYLIDLLIWLSWFVPDSELIDGPESRHCLNRLRTLNNFRLLGFSPLLDLLSTKQEKRKRVMFEHAPDIALAHHSMPVDDNIWFSRLPRRPCLFLASRSVAWA